MAGISSLFDGFILLAALEHMRYNKHINIMRSPPQMPVLKLHWEALSFPLETGRGAVGRDSSLGTIHNFRTIRATTYLVDARCTTRCEPF